MDEKESMRPIQHHQRGFTILELLVVVAIIGLLSSVVLASLNSQRAKARIAAVQTAAGTVQAAATLCIDGEGTLVPPAGTPPSGPICLFIGLTNALWPALPVAGGWVYAIIDDGSAGRSFEFTITGDDRVISCTLSGCLTSSL